VRNAILLEPYCDIFAIAIAQAANNAEETAKQVQERDVIGQVALHAEKKVCFAT
jgi:hypothetical protein